MWEQIIIFFLILQFIYDCGFYLFKFIKAKLDFFLKFKFPKKKLLKKLTQGKN